MAPSRVSLSEDPEAALAAAAGILAGGGVAIFPTETVYGVGAAAGCPEALARLRRLKGREDGKPFQFLAADLEMARALGVRVTPEAERLARRFWPGPLTLVMPSEKGGEGVGIRIPDAPFVLALCRRLGRALVASSANPAGAPPPTDAQAAEVFGEAVDILVDGGRTDGAPSTVASCLDGELRILRPGALDPLFLFAAWREGRGDEPPV
ncbi:MAG: threonylcarbamoyl-AMP synthase [Planctomycetota bacterium]|jgi:L-threonylcarbamoyladenylate synthase|nr:threonylcarbamoyl-AMP synthase [Planctomycetota bacterium]